MSSKSTAVSVALALNNVHVSAAMAYIDALPLEHVGEIHLAGYAEDQDDLGASLLIDAHNRPVADPVWELYRHTLARTGPIPTLIGWDNDVPAIAVLAGEARRASTVINAQCQRPIRRIA
jgi:uncharacterized protein (UPF0276 family)